MKKLLAVAMLVFIATPVAANISSSTFWDVGEIAAPAAGAAGTARIYADSTAHTLRVSLNGAAAVDILTGAAGAQSWVQGGNAFGALGTVGTTDNNAYRVITNNVERYRVLAGGAWLLGSATQVGSENFRATGGTALFDNSSTTAFQVAQTGGGSVALDVDTTNTRIGVNVTPTATLHVVQPVITTGSPTALLLTSGAHTTLTASTESIGVNMNTSATKQFATGALTTQRESLFQAPTYSFVAASTLTTAATLAISGAPVAGTNATITNSYALLVQGGSSGFAGSVVPTTDASQSLGTASLRWNLIRGVTITSGAYIEEERFSEESLSQPKRVLALLKEIEATEVGEIKGRHLAKIAMISANALVNMEARLEALEAKK